MAIVTTPYIPTTITVHLGAPGQSAANVTVPFADYIKNVASSEIYPTWEPSAIRANVLAQMSFALNRVYTGYYRSRGYDFDITSSTATPATSAGISSAIDKSTSARELSNAFAVEQ